MDCPEVDLGRDAKAHVAGTARSRKDGRSAAAARLRCDGDLGRKTPLLAESRSHWRTKSTIRPLFRAEFANQTTEADPEKRRKLLCPRGFEPPPCGLEVARVIGVILREKALVFRDFMKGVMQSEACRNFLCFTGI